MQLKGRFGAATGPVDHDVVLRTVGEVRRVAGKHASLVVPIVRSI